MPPRRWKINLKKHRQSHRTVPAEPVFGPCRIHFGHSGWAVLSCPKTKKVFAELQARLAQLTQKFSEQLLDSTNATIVHITEQAQLAGLPQHSVESAAAEAQRRGLTGWVFTLQHPSVGPVLQFAQNRSLREAIYRKQAVRASDISSEGPQHDNGPIMGEILALRQRQAALLGFRNAAEVSLAPKMADSPQQVIDFLMSLASKARPLRSAILKN